jgi:hypothetical protein
MYKLALLLLPAFVSAKTACDVFPIDDAVVVLSQNAQQKDLGNAGCVYDVATPHLVLMVTPPQEAANAKASFAEMKQNAQKAGAAVKDEPGLGFSAVTKDSQTIFIMKGSSAFSISLSNPGSSTPLPDLLDKMRTVAKRAVMRL